jgi:hypothetical protein
VRRALDSLLVCLAISAYVVAAALAWFHLTMGPPAQRVHIRWAPTVSAVERGRAEREHGLIDGVPFEGRTWQYFLRKRSHADIRRLVTDPRIEDTYHIDRTLFRVQLDRPDLPSLARAWLETDRLGQISLALASIAALITWWSWSSWAAMLLALRRFTYRRATSIEEQAWSTSLAAWRAPGWAVVLAIVWAVIVIPYVAVGPPDFEEYFTGVASTQVAVNAIAHGAWPFWSLDFGLGAPQPLRYHFIFHPLAPLCLATDCHALLRSIASIHLLVGAIFMTLLAARFAPSRLLASAAGLTYCMSSSVVQPMLVDDWPLTAMHDSALPIMLYAVFAIGDTSDRRHALLWSLVLGGIAGLTFSMTFPVLALIIIAIVALTMPGFRQRFPWLALAAAVTVLMGAAKVHQIYVELIRTPAGVGRTDHDDYALVQHMWSAFLRPLPLVSEQIWRSVFFGPPFAVAATVAAVIFHDKTTRPIRIGLLLGVAGLLLPPAWLFNINTAQWIYRAEVNIFGILLAVPAIYRWTDSHERIVRRTAVVVAQLGWVIVAVAPAWYALFAVSVGLARPNRNILISPGIAEEIAARSRVAPGRVIFAPEANDALRLPLFNTAGLAPNELPVLGVPTVSAALFGITTDALYPQSGTLEGDVKATAGAIRSRAFLNALGIRYVVAFGHDTVADGVHEVQQWTNGLRLYENDEAWPEAFFVDALRNDRIPRLPDCGHDRFLCADFSKYDLHRRDDPLQITRLYDGLRLTFPPRESRRYLLITQWYYPEWRVTDGRASLHRAAEQLIGLEIAPGERSVTVQYRPYLRAALFAMGIGTEVAVAIAIAVLATRSRLSA